MILLLFGSTVHTTGINIEGVLANAVAVSVIVTFAIGIAIWLIKRSIAEAVRDAMIPIEKRIDDHDTRIARLEGVNDGRKQAVAAAAVTVKGT